VIGAIGTDGTHKMANPDHVALVIGDPGILAAWHANNEGARLDLENANLSGQVLPSRILGAANLTGATLTGTTLENAKMKGACLRNATLKHTNLTNVDLEMADLTDTQCEGVNFTAACLNKAKVTNARFTSCNFNRAHLYKSNCTGAHFNQSELESTDFGLADLSLADFSGTRLERTDFALATIKDAMFFGATINSAGFLEVRGAAHAIGLDTVRFSFAQDSLERDFETCERSWSDEWIDWEKIRGIGRFQLFGVSYTLLIYLVTFFYVVGQYNEKIEFVKELAAEDAVDEGMPRWASERLKYVSNHLPLFSIDISSLAMLLATLLLVIASVIYTLFCPEEIKEFTRVQWCYELNRSLMHYWVRAWRYRKLRVTCGLLYLVGGLMFGGLAAWKLGWAVVYIWKYVGV